MLHLLGSEYLAFPEIRHFCVLIFFRLFLRPVFSVYPQISVKKHGPASTPETVFSVLRHYRKSIVLRLRGLTRQKTLIYQLIYPVLIPRDLAFQTLRIPFGIYRPYCFVRILNVFLALIYIIFCGNILLSVFFKYIRLRSRHSLVCHTYGIGPYICHESRVSFTGDIYSFI